MCCLALKRALTWSGAVTVHFETTSAEVIPVQRMKQRGVWRVPTLPGHRRRYWATARGADSHVPHNDHHKPRPTSKTSPTAGGEEPSVCLGESSVRLATSSR